MTSLAIEGLKNNINNYKGVMLCTRPNENIGVVRDRPFVSRVDPKDRLGVNPVKKNHVVVMKKRGNPILQRHRAWLNSFKEKVRERKELDETRDREGRERFERIKDQASRTRSPGYFDDRQNNDNDYNQASNKVQNNAQPEQSSPVHIEREQIEVKPNKSATKKKENKSKPKWAYTEEQIQAEEEEELDDLLNFTSNLDYDKYINDLEVKNMVNALKNRIDELKNQDAQEEDWKKKIVDQWNGKDNKKALQASKVDIDYDARSDARSVASESRSVASERTNKTISDLKTKLEAKEKKDWDQLSTTTKKNAVTVEERIAKHVADEILRNNYQFKHYHSNASIRKLLEKEAQKHMEDGKGIRAPQIVNNKEYFTRKDIQDPNNLPYLHRNPAI